MSLKPARWDSLYLPSERAHARIAAFARRDTIWGGARALVLAKRGRLKTVPFDEIVGDVYSASTGNHHAVHEAWECPECGQACLGQDAAYSCCARDPQCSECTSESDLQSTFCGSFCPEHLRAHLQNCDICRKELGDESEGDDDE
jgi:hypothetical protein